MQHFCAEDYTTGFRALSLGIAVESLLSQAAVNCDSGVSWDTCRLGQAATLVQFDTSRCYPLTYRSSIALRLGHGLGKQPHQVAQAIAAQASAIAASELFVEKTGPHLSISPLGEWIEVHIAASGIARWLQSLLTRTADAAAPPAIGSISPSSRPASVEVDFYAIYAHARCCSLLRLAAQRKLIVLEAEAPAIPWLAGRHLRATGQAQQALLLSLIQTLDDVAKREARRETVIHAVQLAYARGASLLGQAFEGFYGACRPLRSLPNSGKSASFELEPSLLEQTLKTQADLGYFWIIQRVLALFLGELGLTPPTEL